MFQKVYRLIETLEDYYASVLFSLPLLVNSALFYIGMACMYNPSIIKKLIFIFLLGSFSIITVLLIAKRVFHKSYPVRTVTLSTVFIGFVGLSLLYSILRFQFSRVVIVGSLDFFLFALPAALWGLDVAANAKWTEMLNKMERVSLFLIPIAIAYLNLNLLNSSPFISRYIGAISYADLSYGLMPLLFAMIIHYVSSDRVFADLKCLEKIKIGRYVRLILILLFWAVIVISSSRGAIVAVFFFLGLLTLYMLCKRINCKKIIVLLLCFVVIFVMDSRNILRFATVYENLKDGEIVTAEEDPAVLENLSAIIASDSEAASKAASAHLIRKINNRGTLYKLAIGEIKKSPLIGMGPLGFSEKYMGGHPHNAVLELLADFGLIIGGLLLLFLLYCAFKLLIVLIKGSKDIAFMIIFMAGMFPPSMISGTFYGSAIIFFCVCFSIGLSQKSQSQGIM